MFQIGGWTAGPALGFVLATVTGAVLIALGIACWKATVAFIKSVRRRKEKAGGVRFKKHGQRIKAS